MSTETIERTDSVESLNFEVRCDIKVALMLAGSIVGVRPCPNSAAWSARWPCCGNLALVCDSHARGDDRWFCVKCNRGVPDLLDWCRL